MHAFAEVCLSLSNALFFFRTRHFSMELCTPAGVLHNPRPRVPCTPINKHRAQSMELCTPYVHCDKVEVCSPPYMSTISHELNGVHIETPCVRKTVRFMSGDEETLVSGDPKETPDSGDPKEILDYIHQKESLDPMTSQLSCCLSAGKSPNPLQLCSAIEGEARNSDPLPNGVKNHYFPLNHESEAASRFKANSISGTASHFEAAASPDFLVMHGEAESDERTEIVASYWFSWPRPLKGLSDIGCL